MPSDDTLDTLSGKGEAPSGRFGWLSFSKRLQSIHWMIILLSVGITLVAWYATRTSIEARAEQRFDREAEQVLELLEEHLQRYADILLVTSAVVSANRGRISAEEWSRFSERLALETQFPAISGLGVARHVLPDALPAFLAEQRRVRSNYHLHPRHHGAFHLPIVHIAPPRLASRVPGFDIAREASRRQAAMRAAYLNAVQMTAPVKLTSQAVDGFVMFAPIYRDGASPAWDDRKRELVGTVTASVLIDKLAREIFSSDNRHVWIRIYDNDELLYDQQYEDGVQIDPSARFARSETLPVYGRKWRIDIASTLPFRQDIAEIGAIAVLVGGLSIDALLLILFMSLSDANRRALQLARHTARELRKKAAALEASNDELERFAYIVSHDLKTPLRGINDLTSFMEEDLEEYLESDAANPDVRRNIGRLHQQVDRANTLIEGILDYSGISMRSEHAERVDSARLVRQVGEMLSLKPGQLELEGDFPVFCTYETRLSQVLTNLIGNAFKYHHSPAQAITRVCVADNGRFYRFSVCDDGPGIDHRFHEQIFEVFKTLQTRDDIESTGVGLSIVKKSVEQLGGSITVTSEVGVGTTFTFDWPKHVELPTEVVANTTEEEVHRAPRAA